MKKLYVASVEVPATTRISMVVYADSSEAACALAEANVGVEQPAAPPVVATAVTSLNDIPDSWLSGSRTPYGGDGLTTVGQYWDQWVNQPKPPFDVNGVLATGQSCGTGLVPPGVDGTTLSTTQPYANVMLACADGAWPVGGTGAYSMVPHIEPMRPGSNLNNIPYPKNIAPGSEPPNTHMVNTIARWWGERGWPDHVAGSTNVSVSGASIVYIGKGGAWRSYAAALEEVRIFRDLCLAQGKTYGVVCVTLTHGEADAKMAFPLYRDGIVKLYDDLNTDIKALTGQSRDIVMIASQESSLAGGLTGSPIQLLQAADLRPGGIVIMGPKYQWPTVDGKHFTPQGYWAIGEKMAQVYDWVVTQSKVWKPLRPRSAVRDDLYTAHVTFDVPFAPLQWDMTIPDPWPNTNIANTHGRGFEVRDQTGAYIWINGVSIEGTDTVRIGLGRAGNPAPVAGPVTISYATTGVRGQLCDSDLTLSPSGFNLKNYACHSVITTP